jgi:sec-independent protein translocase protein TatA
MFGLGIPELIVIFVIALLVFGPKKLPDLGKSIGRAMAEFKKASDDFQESVKSEMKEVEKSADIEQVKKLGNITMPDPYSGGTPKPVPDEAAVEQKPDPAGDQSKSGEASNG